MPTSSNSSKAELRNWISDLGLDTAKLGLFLYVMGLITTSLYYSRFSILTLDLAKAQCILIGVYVVLFYATIPAIVLLTARKSQKTGLISLLLVCVLTLWDLALTRASGYRHFGLFLVVALAVVLQFLLFSDLVSLWRSLSTGQPQIAFRLPPPRSKALIFSVLFCIHFSLSWFPQLPAYYGGGKPLTVQVFTKTPELPANRFIVSKNRPQINKSMDSFTLRLIYETDKDAYFISDLEAEGTLAGYSVMRLQKGEILRIDYNTPKWVQWRGGP